MNHLQHILTIGAGVARSTVTLCAADLVPARDLICLYGLQMIVPVLDKEDLYM